MKTRFAFRHSMATVLTYMDVSNFRRSKMKNILSQLFLILLCAALGYVPAHGQKKRVAVIDFEFGTLQRWWEGNWDVGRGISDLMVDRMVNDGTYNIIERNKIELVLKEQDFSNSARADSSSAALFGKVLGVSAMVTGSVTQFGTEDKKTGFGGIMGRIPVFGGGGVGTQKGKAKVAITARIVDVNTGEILASCTGKGESKRSGLMLGGIGIAGGTIAAGGFSMTSSNFRETILGEATYAAVDDVVRQLVALNGKLPTVKIELRGRVADITGRTVILNIGKSQGVQVGGTLKVLRVLRSVKDPETGKVLREVTEEVGQVQINDMDEASSSGTIISGIGVKVGDLIVNL